MELEVTCAPVPQRAWVRSTVGTGFLGEVFSGYFLTCKTKIRKLYAPTFPEYHLAVIIILSYSPCYIEWVREWCVSSFMFVVSRRWSRHWADPSSGETFHVLVWSKQEDPLRYYSLVSLRKYRNKSKNWQCILLINRSYYCYFYYYFYYCCCYCIYIIQVLGRVKISGHWMMLIMMAKWYSGTLGGLKVPGICLTGEEKLRKNLTQETCPDRGSNPDPLRDRRACYHLLHSGGQIRRMCSKCLTHCS